jgi:hypothetical protein
MESCRNKSPGFVSKPAKKTAIHFRHFILLGMAFFSLPYQTFAITGRSSRRI